MIGVNKVLNNNLYAKDVKTNRMSGNDKAAKLTGTLIMQKQTTKADSWADALQTYSDYFIRY
jgi:hypothetical protein